MNDETVLELSLTPSQVEYLLAADEDPNSIDLHEDLTTVVDLLRHLAPQVREGL